MILTLTGTLVLLGVTGGFAAGFLGVGRGVLLFPLLLYVPPLLGLEALGVRTVAALVMSQVFFATLIGGTAHWRSGDVHARLALTGAVAAAAGSFLGGVGSKWVSEWFLLLLFGAVTLLAATIMFLPMSQRDRGDTPVNQIPVSLVPLGVLSGATGVVVGFLGAGNFLFVPLLIYVLKVPTRIAMGSNLVIAVLSTFLGFLGKLLTGQIPFLMALAVVSGACLGAIGGEWSHRRVSIGALRYVYAGMIGLVALRIWISLLT
jgi:uncharacterized membrane protein YfcA